MTEIYKPSCLGAHPVYMRTSSFPIIGHCPDELKAHIARERFTAANNLADTYLDSLVFYESKPGGKDFGRPSIVIRRDNAKIIFDAVADYTMSEDGSLPPYEEKAVIARASLPVSVPLRVAQPYFAAQSSDEGLIKEFYAATDLQAIEQLDEERKYMHGKLSEVIERALKDQDIRFPPINTADLESFHTWRYLTTALIVHVLPARSFENAAFLKDSVRPKFDVRKMTRSKNAGHNTPKLRG